MYEKESTAVWNKDGIPTSATVGELVEELETLLALAPKPRVWNLRDRNIDSNLLTSLFQRILNLVSESILEIDVSANRLGTMTKEQYSSILGSLAKCPNMRIRFGYDIFIPA